MWHWIALLPTSAPDTAADLPALLQQLGWWSLQFTPRVALLEDAVVLEVAASERLFGGADALRGRISQGAAQHLAERGLVGLRWAHAPTALAALALARQHPNPNVHPRDSSDSPAVSGLAVFGPDAAGACRLAGLPLSTLSAVARHAPTLARLGCQTLADVRALPRAGLSRRFGADVLQALDQAWGQRAEAFAWLQLPPTFDACTELPARTETTAGLGAAFEQLLQALCAWLSGHQAGTQEIELRWCHEWARRGEARWQTWPMRLASPVQDVRRLVSLLKEHLQRITLASPVTDIGLSVSTIAPMSGDSADLFASGPSSALAAADGLITPTAWRDQHDALLRLIERLEIRLGPERVQQAECCADHRLLQAQRWRPAVQSLVATRGQPGGRVPTPGMPPLATPDRANHDAPQPCWLLTEPVPLAMDTRSAPREQPLYQGPLQLLAGPHRVEAGWWDDREAAPAEARDHYLASSPKAGLLWVYRTRHVPADGRSPWFLQGFFA